MWLCKGPVDSHLTDHQPELVGRVGSRRINSSLPLGLLVWLVRSPLQTILTRLRRRRAGAGGAMHSLRESAWRTSTSREITQKEIRGEARAARALRWAGSAGRAWTLKASRVGSVYIYDETLPVQYAYRPDMLAAQTCIPFECASVHPHMRILSEHAP